MRLESIQIGTVRTYTQAADGGPLDRPWTSAIRKDAVEGQVWAGAEGLAGDQVADTRHHGGPWRAVLMYSADHYPLWRTEWDRRELRPGAFGENLTISGLAEDTVCVGDVLAAGDVRLEVTSPRSPCQTLAHRLERPEVVRMIRENHRSGWYLRVAREGWLEAGMIVTLADRPYPQWTVRRAAEIRADRQSQPELAALLAECPALIPEWRDLLGGRTNAA